MGKDLGFSPFRGTEQCDKVALWLLRAFEAEQGNLGKHTDTAFSCSRDLQPPALSLVSLGTGQVSKLSSHAVSGCGFCMTPGARVAPPDRPPRLLGDNLDQSLPLSEVKGQLSVLI